MNIKNVYILEDRSILYINGEDAKDFLQNLISNDINKVSEVNSCFTSLLTPQGKFLYEFIIVKCNIITIFQNVRSFNQKWTMLHRW